MTAMTAMTEKDLLKQITILDFMVSDLHLYLNTHPTDAEALAMYNDTLAKKQEVVARYEALGRPLFGTKSKGLPGWQWSQGPWPWQPEFNFDFNTESERGDA